MKKFIIGASTALTLVFAVALANTEEASETRSEQATVQTETRSSKQAGQQAGVAANAAENLESQEQTCIDEQSVAFRRGERGFQNCVKSRQDLHSKNHSSDDHAGSPGAQSSDHANDGDAPMNETTTSSTG